jgi:hypothetical protein
MFARARGPGSVVAHGGAQKPMSTSALRPPALIARIAVSSACQRDCSYAAGSRASNSGFCSRSAPRVNDDQLAVMRTRSIPSALIRATAALTSSAGR